MAEKVFNVAAAWDAECRMWYVSHSDVPGLNTEAETLEALIDRVTAIAPELLELNGLVPAAARTFPVRVTAERETVVSIN